MLKYKVGDKIKVISGKDKGREGTIEVLLPKENKAIVSGINMFKRHIKKQYSQDGNSGIMEFPRPIHLSKLSLIDPKTKKTFRVGFETKGGKKLRINKKTKLPILDKTK